MLLAVSVCPFACALVLFYFGFDYFLAQDDTHRIVNAMRQINHPDTATDIRPAKRFAAGA
ncbi:MAG TPA: hypothetical protein VFQ00_01840 [Terriglobales bacterium]|nr:hypothetical protein [Terriglobales bacterium]